MAPPPDDWESWTMGKVKVPSHPLEKRELLHKDPPDTARIDAIAGALIDARRFGEAIEFVEVTRNAGLLGRLEDEATSSGSPFLLQQVERLSGQKRDDATWEAVVAKCLAAERYVDAVRALNGRGESERAEEIRAEHCPDYDPFKPLGK